MSNTIQITNDPVSNEIVKGYTPKDQDFIHQLLFPEIRVGSRKGDIRQVGTEFLRLNSDIQVDRSGTKEITVSITKGSGWDCEESGLQILTLRKDGEQFNQQDWQAGMQDARIMFGKMLKTAKMIGREKEAADALTSTSVITNNATLSGSDQWSDKSGSDPLSDIETGKDAIYDATGREANTAYMSRAVFKALKFHPALFEKLGTTNSSERLNGLTEAQMAVLFGVDRVVVGRVRYESAKEGQSSSMANVWGKHFGLAYINPNPNPNEYEFSLGYRFYMDPMIFDYYDVKDPKFAQYSRITETEDQLIMNATSAYLIRNAIA